MEETAGVTETKKILDNPRVEIDTSPPFESVKQAVDWFSGRGPWMQHHLLRLAAHHRHETGSLGEMEEQAVQLERDLMLKEQEALKLLKQLEAAKRLVETLKCHLMPEFSPFLATPHQNLETRTNDSTEDLSLFPVILSPGLMFMELNRAKTNLNKTSVDLAMIQESVESLNKKMRRDRALLERRMEMEARDCGKPKAKAEAKGRLENCTNIAMGLEQADFETEQFKKMTEASRYEVMKAMVEIERTKNSIKMAEMRLNAAKKMEEAAKAVEEIALAERSLTSSDVFLDHKPNGITLTFEEYRSLTQKANQVEETKFIDANAIQTRRKDHQSEVAAVTEKSEEMKQENQHSRVADLRTRKEGSLPSDQDRFSKFKFRNSRSGGHRTAQVANENGSNGTTSMGDILNRKLILQDNIIVGKHVENQHGERGHVSLSQMLREQSRTILHPGETTGDDEHGGVEKLFFVQTKKFGFIHVPISIKKTKKKVQT